MVICLEQGADLHRAQLMPLPLTVSCFSKIQIGLPFWYRLTRVVPDKGPLNGCVCVCVSIKLHTHAHTCLMALCPGLPRLAGTRKAKPILIFLKQETLSGSGISWAICKSATCSRQIAPHQSVSCRPDALPVGQPTVSKH